MTGAGRQTTAMAMGIAFHIAALGALGLAGFLSAKPPVIDEPVYEVSLIGSGSLAAATKETAAAPAAKPVQEIAPPKADDIVEETKENPPEKPAEQTETKPQDNTAQSRPDSTAQKNGNGQGSGSGDGAGDGDKAGNGSGSAIDGNAIQTPAVAPSILRAVQPDYPPSARRRGVEGTAYLRILLDKAGVPESVEIMESAGDVYLDEAAAEAVEEWRFSPGLDGQGRPVRCYVQVPVAFRLN
ncbi:MAG: TonB family protein [Selenomonadaceae bacterium]|nr:TonB family protein [Selenomonadaceae bacterium]